MYNKFLKNIEENFESWLLIQNAIKNNERLSLVQFLKDNKIKENLRSTFIQLGLIVNVNNIAKNQPIWQVSDGYNNIKDFTDLYLKVQKENKGVVYVFDKKNKIVFQSINKHEIFKKYGVQHKVLFIIVRNGESKNGYYFSFDKNFKIVEKPKLKNKIKSKPIKQVKKSKVLINSYEHKKNQTLEAVEVLKMAKNQNKPVIRLKKMGLDSIKRICAK